jgi:predicted XRE-type DNA-binding protein
MKVETFASVWDAISDSPAEAADLTARSDLMLALAAHVRAWNLPPDAAAARLGIARSRLSDLLRGKVDRFPLAAVVNLVAVAELHDAATSAA